MGYTPRIGVAPCPGCHSICGEPKLRHRFRWRTGFWVRLECACGIAGAWQRDETSNVPWNIAARGWSIVAGYWPMTPPPPKPSS